MKSTLTTFLSSSSTLNRRQWLGGALLAPATASGIGGLLPRTAWAKEQLPKHLTPETLKAIRLGLDFLARGQSSDGAWHDGQDADAYPVAISSLAGLALLANGNTPTRGRYAPQIQGAIDFLLRCSTSTGLITGSGEDSGRPMHGHGFALLFLASAYGSIHKDALRDQVKTVIKKAVALTAQGQSGAGGWTYTPGSGDEGSVTVTQVQGLRAAKNAGFVVPKGTIEEAVRYIERCQTDEGGISYSLGSGGGPRLAISAASVATLYNAGEFDAPVAERCLEYVWRRYDTQKGWSKGDGHDFYSHLYASQGFYMAGDKYWDNYFPDARANLLQMQDRGDGSWNGDGIGKSYGTAIALIILQLPYKYLPVFQR